MFDPDCLMSNPLRLIFHSDDLTCDSTLIVFVFAGGVVGGRGLGVEDSLPGRSRAGHLSYPTPAVLYRTLVV